MTDVVTIFRVNSQLEHKSIKSRFRSTFSFKKKFCRSQRYLRADFIFFCSQYSGTNAEFTKADTVIFRTDLYNLTNGRKEYNFKRTLKYDSKWLDSKYSSPMVVGVSCVWMKYKIFRPFFEIMLFAVCWQYYI